MPTNHEMPEPVSALDSPESGLRVVAWIHRQCGQHLVMGPRGAVSIRDYEPMPCEERFVGASR